MAHALQQAARAAGLLILEVHDFLCQRIFPRQVEVSTPLFALDSHPHLLV